MCGGFAMGADLANVTVLRQKVGEAKMSMLVYDFNKLIDGEIDDVALLPGDVVHVGTKVR